MLPRFLPTLAAIGIFVAGATAFAQMEREQGAAPVDSSGSYEISGVTVDVAGKSAEAARLGGWRLAQRKAWTQLSGRLGKGGGAVSDGTLDSLVSGIVIENEQIGPNRYVARLGVLFDRSRTGEVLGIPVFSDQSRPMLVIPLQVSAGVDTVFEQRNPWQEAWARFRTGNSAVDYIRPSGTGADSLLLNAGQIGRPGRGWWRTIIDQYGASDILIPVVRLHRLYPGGPIVGRFEARHGPDNRYLGSFTLRVGNAGALPQLLDVGVKRLDGMFQNALRSGSLGFDPSLAPIPEPTPTATPTTDVLTNESSSDVFDPAIPATMVTIQFDTPSAAAVANVESEIRSVPGVRSAATTSLALGGLSLMRVTYGGDAESLRAALEVRGYQVLGSGPTIRIRRAPQLIPQGLPAEAPTPVPPK